MLRRGQGQQRDRGPLGGEPRGRGRADAGYVTVAPAHRRRTVKGCMRTYVMHQQLLEHLPVPLAPVLEVGERLVVYRRERSTRLAHRNTIQGTTSQRMFP